MENKGGYELYKIFNESAKHRVSYSEPEHGYQDKSVVLAQETPTSTFTSQGSLFSEYLDLEMFDKDYYFDNVFWKRYY